VKVQNITSEHATSVAVTGACKVTPCAKFTLFQILLTCLSRVTEHLSVPLSFYHSANFTARFSLSVWDWVPCRSLLNYGNSRVFSSKPGLISCAKGVMLCEQYGDKNITNKNNNNFTLTSYSSKPTTRVLVCSNATPGEYYAPRVPEVQCASWRAYQCPTGVLPSAFLATHGSCSPCASRFPHGAALVNIL
jgi:hypothetical protein